jgi:hypothetical protein
VSVPTIIPYNRARAVEYAHKWAYGRNPMYYDYEKLGGDCTNFASQCLYAGTGIMDYTPTFGWYYISANNKAPAWTSTQYFYQYITRASARPGPFGIESKINQVEPGDFVQLSFRNNIFSHTPIIVEIGNPPTLSNTLVAAHSYDSDYKPLSLYVVERMRFLHILGAYLR